MKFQTKTIKVVIVSILLSLILVLGLGYYFYKQASSTSNLKISQNDIITINDTLNDEKCTAQLDSLSSLSSHISDSAQCYRIMITGIDSRLGSGSPHADANHLLSIYPDKAYIDIVSIPRGTFSPAGQSDSSRQNYLANTRAIKGRSRYLSEVCRIAAIDTIPYFVEFGFSQAIGLIKLLGFGKNSLSTLRVLRSRKSFPQGDYQRCYNQGQFIRQMILKHFEAMKTSARGIILPAAFALIESNLPKDTANMIIHRLIAAGFPNNISSVTVRLKPAYSQVNDYDFTNNKSIDSLHQLIVRRAPHDSTFTREQTSDEISKRMYRKLQCKISDAEQCSNSPNSVIRILKQIYIQKAWYQIEDINKSEQIHSRIFSLLRAACVSIKDSAYIKQLDKENSAEMKAFAPLTKKETKTKYSFWLLGKEFILGEY